MDFEGMRIAFIRKEYTPYGGAERYVNTLARRLLELGHEVHMFANKWPSESDRRQPRNKGLVLHQVPMVRAGSAMEVLSFALNAKTLVQKERFDVVHSFERTLCQDIYRAGDGCHKEWLIQRAKYEPMWKRASVSVRLLHKVLLWIEESLFDPRNTKTIIANSHGGKQEIVTHYGFPAGRIHVVHNGVDTERFNPSRRLALRDSARRSLGLGPRDRVVLFLGSGFERKGLVFALRAIKACDDVDIRLIVAGRDSPRKYVRLARRLGIGGRICFVGAVKSPERLYAAADVFLLPTIYDPFSNACLEAIACGIPVVTTRKNGASEILSDGDSGFVIEDLEDILSWRDKLTHAFDLDVSGKRKERISDLTWEKQISRMLAIYEAWCQ